MSQLIHHNYREVMDWPTYCFVFSVNLLKIELVNWLIHCFSIPVDVPCLVAAGRLRLCLLER